MELTVISWDDISCETGTRVIELDLDVERDSELTPEQVAEKVDLAVERYNQDNPTLEATEYTVVKATGWIDSGCGWFTDDRDHQSVLIWDQTK